VDDFIAPRTELEEKLAAIWERVLNVNKVGMNDKFLDIGGHSLLAVRVASQLKSELGIDISIAALFQYETIESLSNYIQVMQGASNKGGVEYELIDF
jgi:acyl carrier protein